MAKSSKSKNKPAAQIDPYLEGLMAKLLERLTGLERKMDTVLSRMGQKPSGNGDSHKPFQQPQHQPHQQQHQQQHAQQPHRENRIMHEAICADCAKVCEVPFKPVEGRAIYCKPCFAARKSGGMNAMPKPLAMPPKPVPTENLPHSTALPKRQPKAAQKSKPAKKPKKK